MSEIVVNLYEAKSRLSALVERAAAGEEIIIARRATRRPGSCRLRPRSGPGSPAEDSVWIANDFDEPLPPEILKAFTGEK